MRILTQNPARIEAPFSHHATESSQQTARVKRYISPLCGWVTNANLASQDTQSAVILDNFWPETTGLMPRGGALRRLELPSAVQSLFSYSDGKKSSFFAATANDIYLFGPETDVQSPLQRVMSGRTGGVCSVLEVQNEGGHFLSVVNGSDPLCLYDGTSWCSVTDEASPYKVENVDTSRLVWIWAYRNRQFFIEKDTMHAWYLGINSIAGPATKLPLAGLFNKGGTLLFGATWSSDSGAGMDDRCVFVTTQGEFAIFSGDPIDRWNLAGIYDIGKPLGREAFLSVGGDLIIATKGGLISVATACKKDSSELKLVSLARDIEPDWLNETSAYSGKRQWKLVKWEERNMALVAPANGVSCHHCFVVNLGTGRWSRFVGWRISTLSVLDDVLYYADEKGNVFQANVGGMDDGKSFMCRVCFAFDDLSSAAFFKKAHLVRGIFRYSRVFEPEISIAADYQPFLPCVKKERLGQKQAGTAPLALAMNGQLPQWDKAYWDERTWDEQGCSVGGLYQIKDDWEQADAHGYALAVQLRIVSDKPQKLDCTLLAVDMAYSVGEVFI